MDCFTASSPLQAPSLTLTISPPGTCVTYKVHSSPGPRRGRPDPGALDARLDLRRPARQRATGACGIQAFLRGNTALQVRLGRRRLRLRRSGRLGLCALPPCGAACSRRLRFASACCLALRLGLGAAARSPGGCALGRGPLLRGLRLLGRGGVLRLGLGCSLLRPWIRRRHGLIHLRRRAGRRRGLRRGGCRAPCRIQRGL